MEKRCVLVFPRFSLLAILFAPVRHNLTAFYRTHVARSFDIIETSLLFTVCVRSVDIFYSLNFIRMALSSCPDVQPRDSSPRLVFNYRVLLEWCSVGYTVIFFLSSSLHPRECSELPLHINILMCSCVVSMCFGFFFFNYYFVRRQYADFIHVTHNFDTNENVCLFTS